MKITKNYLNKIFEESKNDFKNNIYDFPHNIELEFIDKDKFLEDAMQNQVMQLQIKMGLFKDFKKEYPGFLVVYAYNKDKMRSLFNLPMKVSVCDEIAKEKLKKFTTREVSAFLRYAFIHEITHIYEDELIEAYKDEWGESLKVTRNNEHMAKEDFVEKMIEKLIPNKKEADEVSRKLWSLIEKRANDIQKSRRK